MFATCTTLTQTLLIQFSMVKKFYQIQLIWCTNITIGKSTEQSTDLKICYQFAFLRIYRSHKQLFKRPTVCAQLCHHQEEKSSPAAVRNLVRTVDSQPKTTQKQVYNESEAAEIKCGEGMNQNRTNVLEWTSQSRDLIPTTCGPDEETNRVREPLHWVELHSG